MFGNSAGSAPEAGNIPQRLAYPTDEVAALLGDVTPRYVDMLIADGSLESIKLGRRRLVEHEALIKFMDGLREQARKAREHAADAA